MSKAVILIALSVSAQVAMAQNVGIGTTNPLSKLHVAGCIRSDTLIGTGVRSLFAAPNGRIYDSLVVPSALSWEIGGNNNITPTNFLGTTTPSDVIFKTNSVEHARLLSAGGMGVETAVLDFASTKLQVNGGHILSGDGGGVVFKDPTAAVGFKYWQFRNSNLTAGDFVIKTLDDLGVTQLDVMAMTRAGNVGIGTLAPDYKLHVNINDATAFAATNNATWLGSKIQNSSTTAGSAAGMTLRSNTFDAGVFAITDGTANGGRLAFVADNPQTESMTIWQNKVGIGTISPANKLEINSGAANTSGLRFTNLTAASPTIAANGKALSVDANGDVVLMPSASDAWKLLGNAGTTAGTNFIGTTDAQDLVFKTNNLERMRTLASNGNVGVGHTAPLSKLTVMERFDGNFSVLNPFTKLTGISAEDNTDFVGMSTEDMDGNLATSNDAGGLIYWGDDGNEPLNFKYLLYNGTGFTPLTVATFLPNGNVGINVTNPTRRLEIASASNAALYATRNFNGIANSDAGFIGGIDASYANTGVYFVQKDNVSLGSYATNLINVVSNGVPKMVVNGTGNMRIGNQFYNTQNAGAAIAPDAANVKLAVTAGYSSFGGYNSDPVVNAAPSPCWINGVGTLVTGMNRIPGTSNVDFWNATDPGNGAAALTATDRGFNWRNFNLVAGNSVENSLMVLNGLGNLTISGTNYFTSDRRLKSGVQAFENNVLAKVMRLQPSTYQKHSSSIDAAGNLVIHAADEPVSDFGFIAQDVYDIFPELVSKPKNEAKELWAVDYARLSVMLTKALQEQQQLIESQEQRIQKLEKALAELLEKK